MLCFAICRALQANLPENKKTQSQPNQSQPTNLQVGVQHVLRVQMVHCGCHLNRGVEHRPDVDCALQQESTLVQRISQAATVTKLEDEPHLL